MSKKIEIRLNDEEKASLAQQLKYHLAAVEGDQVEFTGFIILTLATCSEDDCTRTHFNFGCHFPQEMPDEVFYTLLRGAMARGIEEVADHQRSNYIGGRLQEVFDSIGAVVAKETGNLQ